MLKSKKKICIIGLGYIGLPTAALLSSKGYSVSGTDTNKHVVNTINKGKTNISEIGLNKLVKNAVKKVLVMEMVNVERFLS